LIRIAVSPLFSNQLNNQHLIFVDGKDLDISELLVTGKKIGAGKQLKKEV